jgi:hypothetical protein
VEGATRVGRQAAFKSLSEQAQSAMDQTALSSDADSQDAESRIHSSFGQQQQHQAKREVAASPTTLHHGARSQSGRGCSVYYRARNGRPAACKSRCKRCRCQSKYNGTALDSGIAECDTQASGVDSDGALLWRWRRSRTEKRKVLMDWRKNDVKSGGYVGVQLVHMS